MLALACALSSCAKRDPFDQSFIDKDLRKRTAQEVHDAADKFAYEPPADRKLTEQQIANYVNVMKLAERIRATAQHDANEAVDRASSAGGVSRVGEAAAAIGAVRSYATAELRACLNLGLNPKEHQWVAQHVDSALSQIDELVRLEKETDMAKDALDREIDPVLMNSKRHAYEAAADAKERWMNSLDPAALENAEVVRKHKHEIVPPPSR
jgi:hypothetical protein